MAAIVVIIPTYNDWDRLRLCLSSLEAQTLSNERFEVIIANNDARHPTPPFPVAQNVRVIVEPTPGSYSARNAAVLATDSEILAFTDSDCIPDADWLEQIVEELRTSPTARISGQVPIFKASGGKHVPYIYEFHTAFRQKEYAERGEGATANLAIRRTVFMDIGLFNSDLLSGGDFEWHRRAHAAGVPIVYAPNVVVRHPARLSLKEIFYKRRRTARSEAMFHKTSMWNYIKFRVKPPLGRIVFDRGNPNWVERTSLFMTMYAINLYAVYNFVLVRLGIVKAVRS